MRKKFTYPILLAFSIFTINSFAQSPVYFSSGNYANPNSFTQGSAALMGTIVGTNILTTNANATGFQYFRFYSATSGGTTYEPNGGADILISSNTSTALQVTGSGKAYYLNIASASDNIVFKTNGSGTPGTAKLVAFQIAGTIQTVSSVTQSPTIANGVNSGQTTTVTANLSGSLPTGQSVYLRYTNNGYATSTVVQLTGAGTTYTGTIPAGTNTASANVSYYVFTSNGTVGSASGPAANGGDADLFTINLNNNGGPNYTYTVGASTITYPYVTAQTGNWTTTTTWQGGVVPPTSANWTISASNTITLDVSVNGGTGTINGSLTQNNNTVSLGNTTAITAITVANGGLITVGANCTTPPCLKATMLTVQNGGNFTNSAGNASVVLVTNFNVNNGGIYNHDAVGSGAAGSTTDFPGSTTRTLGATSNVNITKWGVTAQNPPALPGIAYGNLLLNPSTTWSGSIQQSASITTILGNLTIQATGGTTREFRFTGNTALANLTIGGSVSVSGGNLTFTNGSGLTTLSIIGSVNVSGGQLNFSTGSSSPTCNITGNLIQSNGIIEFGSNTGAATINLTGNLQASAGTLQTLGSGFNGQLNFGGTTQSFQALGTNQYVDFNIKSGSTTTLASSVSLFASTGFTETVNVLSGGILVCPSAFAITDNASSGTSITNVQSGGTIQIASTGGIASSGATGNVQTLTRTFNTGANYTYVGSASQGTGTGLPATVNNLTINNSSGVTVTNAATTVNGILTLTAGKLVMGSNNITVAGSISGGSSTVYVQTNSTGKLIRTVAGTAVTFPVGNSAYNPLTITNTGTSDNFSIRVVDVVTSPVPNNGTKLVNRYWGITEGTIGGNNLLFVAQFNAGEPNANFAAGTTAKQGLYSSGSWVEQLASASGVDPVTYTNTTNFTPSTLISEGFLGCGKDDGFLGASNIALSSANPSVPVANIQQNTTNNVIYKLQLDVTIGSTTLTGLNVTTTGSYVSADVTNLKCWYSTSSTFATGTSTLLSTLTTPGVAGAKTFPSFTTQSIPVSTAYLYITSDIPCAATTSNTILISAIATADISFSNGAKSGTTSASGTQTITTATPIDVTGASVTPGNGQLVVSWSNPSCYDEIMVVATDNAGVTTVPTGDGTSYTASSVYNDGTNFITGYPNEFCVYRSNSTTVTITNLINLTTYQLKIFVRKGTSWSAGFSLPPATPASSTATAYYRSRQNGNWSDFNTWQISIDFGATWNSAVSGQYPSSSTTDVTVRAHTVTLNASGYTLRNLTINSAGKLYCNTNTSNKYLNVYGDITCDGTVGNLATPDDISFNIEGTSCTLSGAGNFACSRIRKNAGTNLTTAFIVNMDVNTYWSGTQLYNNYTGSANAFNVTINSTKTFTCNNGGSVAIDGSNGAAFGNSYGTFTVNGTLTIPGTLYLSTNNTNTLHSCKIAIGSTGIINAASISAAASGAATHTLVINNGGLLNINGTAAFTIFNALNNVNTLIAGSTVDYSFAGSQPIEAGLSYSNLTLSGSGTKTANGNVAVGNTFTLNGTASYRQTGLTTTIASGGTFYGGGGSIASGTAGGTVSFAGTGTISGTNTVSFYNLNINSGTVTQSLNNNTATNLNLVGGLFSVGTGNQFNIANTGTIVSTNGDFASGSAAGNISFISVGTVTVAAGKTLNFYIVYLPALGSANSPNDVNFGSTGTPVINNSLVINIFRFVSSYGPAYASGSTLIYNTSGSYNRNFEWSATAAGTVGTTRGYPYNIIVQNGTSFDVSANISGNAPCAGNLSLGNATSTGSVTMNGMTNTLIIGGNINIGSTFGTTSTLTLSSASGGDLYVGGNWSRTSAGIFAPNNRAVFFNGSLNADQTITVTATGSKETFPYLRVSKPDNFNIKPVSTDIDITGGNAGGNTLELLYGGIDLNGRIITFTSYNGGINNFAIDATGASLTRQITSSTGTGTFAFTHSDASAQTAVISRKTATLSLLNYSSAVKVTLAATGAGNGGVNFGSGLTTIGGTLQINSKGFVNTNPPTYATNSLLQYNTGGSYLRFNEWNNTSGNPGYPYNVQISTAGTIFIPAGTSNAYDATSLNMAGNLTIDASCGFDMTNANLSNMTVPLTVGGDILINGSLSESQSTGGDISLAGNWTNNGTFTPYSRNVTFNGTSSLVTQTIAGSNSTTFYDLTNSNTTAVSVTQGNDATVSNAFTLNTGSNHSINGNTLTLNGTITGTGTITGSSTSNLTVGGTSGGSVGTLTFKTTAAANYTLNNFTLGRSGASPGATMGSNLIVGATADITNTGSALTIGANTLTLFGTIAGLGTLTGSSSSNLTVSGSTGGSVGTLNFTTGAQTLNDVTVSRSGSGANATLGAALTVGGIFSNPNSTTTFTIGANTLSLNGTVSGSGTFTGGTSSNLTIGGSSGSTLGSLYFTGGAQSLNTLTIDRVAAATAAAVANSNTLTVSTLTLKNGILATGDNLFTVTSVNGTAPAVSAWVANTPETSLKQSFVALCDASGTPVSDTTGAKGFRINGIGTTDIFVPIGYNLTSSPNRLTLRNNTTTTDNYTIVLLKGDIGGTPLFRVNRIWHIKKSGSGASNVSMKLYFIRKNSGYPGSQDEVENGFIYNDARLLHRIGAYPTFGFANTSGGGTNGANDVIDFIVGSAVNTEVYAAYTYGNSGDNTNSQTANGITDFSGLANFSIANVANIILPVNIVSVKAYELNKTVKVDWTALTEINVARYEIERSTNAVDFKAIGTTPAAGSNSVSRQYGFTDAAPLQGYNFYRIKAVDNDGKALYSKVVSVNINGEKDLITIYPNPVKNRAATVQFNGVPPGRYNLVLYDMAGKSLLQKIIRHPGGTVSYPLNLPSSFANGIYPITISGGKIRIEKSLVIE